MRKSAKSVQWGQDGQTISSDPQPQTIVNILPFDPAQDMVIGGQGGVQDGQWRFSTADLERLRQGYEKVVIGGDAYRGRILLDGASTPLNP